MSKSTVKLVTALLLCLTVLVSVVLPARALPPTVAGPPAPLDPPAPQPDPSAAEQRVYLPLVARRTVSGTDPLPTTYTGRITYLGLPLAGQPVELVLFDGVAWSVFATVTTAADGSYVFPGLPPFSYTDPLVWQRQFYVRWRNTAANPLLLADWTCELIDIYTLRTAKWDCSFDVETVRLLSPASGQTYGLPLIFRWELRQHIGDVYALNIADMSDLSPWWWDYPSPGEIDTYIMHTRPWNLDRNRWYGWFVTIEGPNGYGRSSTYRALIFTGPEPSSAPTAGSLAGELVQTGEETLAAGRPGLDAQGPGLEAQRPAARSRR